jgi:competence protein ComEA
MPTDERPLPAPAPVGYRSAVVDDVRARLARRSADLAEMARSLRSRMVLAAVAVCLVAAAWWLFHRDGRPSIETVLPRAAAISGLTTSGGDATSGPTGSSGAVVVSPLTLVVHVVGAVVAPGVVRVPAGSRVLDAVAAAGGPTLVADVGRVNLAAKLTDGQRVVVPAVGESPPIAVGGDSGSAPGDAVGVPSPATPVNLNEATAAQLDTLPGVGPATAAAIIAYRTQHGPFRTVDGLGDVRGIGSAKLEQLRPLVTV